ncbi:hypothetical protein GCM10027082_39310 [Comamonas humi]
MSRKHAPLPRLAPLAAAAALLCVASAATAQQYISVPQVQNGTTSATATFTPGPGGAVTQTFSPTNTTINSNGFNASGTGNQATSTHLISSQVPSTPTVTVTQTVNAATSATTSPGKIGIDTTNLLSPGNGGNRTGAHGTVNGNNTRSTATANDNTASLDLQNPAGVTLGTPATVGSGQAANANVTATTLDNLLGIALTKRAQSLFSDTSWSGLALDVNSNNAAATATANQTSQHLGIDTAADLNISAPAASNVLQVQSPNASVAAGNTVNTLGITLGQQLGIFVPQGPSGSSFNVNDNSAAATAQGNQVSNELLVNASNVNGTGAASPMAAASSQSSGAVGANSNVGTLGVQNNTLTSVNNAYAVNQNDVTASATGNHGSNQAQVDASAGISNLVLGASSTQASGAVGANAQVGTLGVSTVGSAGDRVNVNQNTVSSSAMGSSADNLAAATAGSGVTGSSVGAANLQGHAAGNISASSSVNTLGAQTGASLNGNQVVNGNSVQASAQDAYARNRAVLQASSAVTNGTAGAVNSQTHGDGNVSATSQVNLLGSTTTLLSAGDTAVVNGNAVDASAMGLEASNLAAVSSASSVTGGVANVLNGQAHTAGDVSASANAPVLGTQGLLGTVNGNQTIAGNQVTAAAQGMAADSQSTVQAGSSVTNAFAGVTSVQTHTSGNTSANSSVGVLGRNTLLGSSGDISVVNDNAVGASALGMQGSNLASISGLSDVSGASAPVLNTQLHSAGDVNARATAVSIGTIALTGSQNGSQTVNGNSVAADAMGSQADNESTVKAGGALTNAVATVGNSQTHVAGNTMAFAGAGLIGSGTAQSTNDQLVVNGNQLSANATSQQASNTAALDGSSITATLPAGAAVANDQVHNSGNVTAIAAGVASSSPSPTLAAPAMIGTTRGSTVGGSAQVSSNEAQANANINLAANTVSLNSGTDLDTQGVGLANTQTVNQGDATALVRVNYGLTGTRAGGNTVVVSNNHSASAASQNQAINTVTVKAGSALGSMAPAIVSAQTSSGATSSTTQTQLLSGVGTAGSSNGDTTISGNQSSSNARANVANNALTIDSGTLTSNLGGSLTNGQTNYATGVVTAVTSVQIPIGSSSTNQSMAGATTVSGNSADALGVGNAALNSIVASAGTALNGGSSLSLLNGQYNYGAINATTTLDVPVFSSGNSGNVNVVNNTATATAIGNNAVNQITATALPSQLVASVGLTSTQINSGNVTATVVGGFTNTGGGAGVNISGNQANAVAVGNRAVSSTTIGVQ